MVTESCLEMWHLSRDLNEENEKTYAKIWRRAFKAAEAGQMDLMLEWVWHIQSLAKRPLWLNQREQKKKLYRMRSEREAGMGQIIKSLVGHFKSFKFEFDDVAVFYFPILVTVSLKPHALLQWDPAIPTSKKCNLLFHFLVSRQLLWLFWPIKYGRRDTVPVLGTALNWSDSFSFPPSGSQLPCKKCGYSETTMLWKAQATWRDSEEWDAMWRKMPRSTEVPDMWLKKSYWGILQHQQPQPTLCGIELNLPWIPDSQNCKQNKQAVLSNKALEYFVTQQ